MKIRPHIVPQGTKSRNEQTSQLECNLFRVDEFKACIIQFSRIPLDGAKLSPEAFSQSVNYLPLVGGLLALLAYLPFFIWPIESTATLSVSLIAFMVVLTGAMHEDGLADCLDGFFGGFTQEKRLAIMKDSTLGTYAMLGLTLSILLKYTLLSGLSLALIPLAFISAQVISRIQPLLIIGFNEYITLNTDTKMAKAVILDKTKAITLSALPLLIIALLTSFSYLFLTLAFILLTTVLLNRLFIQKIGGYNGDCLGLSQQIAEIGCLVIYSALFL